MVNPFELYRTSLTLLGKPLLTCRFCQMPVTRKLTTQGHHDKDANDLQENSQNVDTKRLDIAIIGHPNAGKSTLVNNLCGKNIMPVSSKVHTTRAVMHGYVTEGNEKICRSLDLFRLCPPT